MCEEFIYIHAVLGTMGDITIETPTVYATRNANPFFVKKFFFLLTLSNIETSVDSVAELRTEQDNFIDKHELGRPPISHAKRLNHCHFTGHCWCDRALAVHSVFILLLDYLLYLKEIPIRSIISIG